MDFDHFTVVLLMRPADAPELTEEEAAALQDRHLAHLSSLHDEGTLVAAGPFIVGDDEELRGLVVFRGDADTVAATMANDPAVQAGRLRVVTLRGWSPPAPCTSSQHDFRSRSPRRWVIDPHGSR